MSFSTPSLSSSIPTLTQGLSATVLAGAPVTPPATSMVTGGVLSSVAPPAINLDPSFVALGNQALATAAAQPQATAVATKPPYQQALLQGMFTPFFALNSDNNLQKMANNGQVSYAGQDLRVMIELADLPSNGVPRVAKQLVELTTLTVSIHRSKSQVVAGGFINPVGIARGRRTVAGTMIMTKFTADVLAEFLQSGLILDASKDTAYNKIDQLPPFNMSLFFCNEQGFASYQRLLGVELVTDGSVYSIQDMLSEQTISYIASDFTPLMPLNFNPMYTKPATFTAKQREALYPQKTVQSVWKVALQ